jgi:3-dehydroquinate dehydratase/shikimate dehydrogenase
MDRVRLCVTVAAATMADLRAGRDAAAGVADLVELRLDAVEQPDVAGALADRLTPVIVTCRPVWEGGAFTGSEHERLALLTDALELGAEYVDVEFAAGVSALIARTGGRRVIVSSHDFEGVPTDLEARVAAMRATGAEVVKVAVTARTLSACLPLLALARRDPRPLALMAMGASGVATRILASRFGSCWVYAGDAIAPGQIPPRRMLGEFGFRRIGPSTRVYGVIGRPVAHSVSPAMHNAAFQATGLDAVYLPLEAESVDDFMQFARAVGVAGASVTAPFKVEAFERADECDSVSRRIGAVNTLKREDDRWVGCNTDVEGFLAPLATVMPLAGARATVLGAGGAARSVVAALASSCASVTVSARRRGQAAALSDATGSALGDWPPPIGTWDLLVNATPVGTHPHVDDMPIPETALAGGLVYDLVYNPPRTALLGAAERRGCRTIGGLDMLVAQARAQFAWWTGTTPAPDLLHEAATTRLHEMNRS